MSMLCPTFFPAADFSRPFFIVSFHKDVTRCPKISNYGVIALLDESYSTIKTSSGSCDK